MHDDRAARSQQPHAFDDELRLVDRIGVDEHQVVGLVGQPGEHFLRPPADQPGPRRPDAGLGERLLGQPLMLGLDVDRGQHAVVAHARQQPQPADAGARADLDDRLGAGQLGQHAQQCADRGGDRARADVDGALAGGGDDRVLGDRPSACVTIDSARLCGRALRTRRRMPAMPAA